MLTVGLLDGRVVAVDASSGSVLWTFDSGAPMLSVQQSEGSPAGTHIFPGVDGALYAYLGIHGKKAKLEVRAPCNVAAWDVGGATVIVVQMCSLTRGYNMKEPVSDPNLLPSACSQRLPITLPDLVDASPSLTDDGSLIVGQRMSSVFVLDAVSGQPLRVLTGNADDRAAAGMCLARVLHKQH